MNNHPLLYRLLLSPPPLGASSDLATYIRNPMSRQPSKKAYQGVNAASTVTAAFSTSSATSPTRSSIYTNKRNALASPAKGGPHVPRTLLICQPWMGLKIPGSLLIYRARPEALLKIYRWEQLIASHLLNRPQSSPILPFPPEALPKFYIQTQ